ncbi:CBO0543 family protein [Bacillus massilinigeriensis]|uniref:CBO0543 family protein n=1 Tax=Bacillus massilionigeriensis TaxID=1805475 RepID=UPI00114D402A|nr:CBO0543 family protein [Bacillus massilionigeriensis]
MFLGVDLLWWGYPDKLFSMIPPLFPADLVVIPVTIMLIYQFNKNWKSFIIAIIIWAAVLSYLIEPAFIHFNLLAFEKWSHTKSFFGFIMFGFINKLIIVLMIKGVSKEKSG